MDTHKDFIHIDDVFKDLRNGEEQEPSGAWLRMKDLLDKEMPAGTPVSAGRSFRRYIIPLVALLLAGGGFTYYEMSEHSKNAVVVNAPAHVIAGNTSGNDKGSRIMSGGQKTNTNASNLASTKGVPEHNNFSTNGNAGHKIPSSPVTKTTAANNSNHNNGTPNSAAHSNNNHVAQNGSGKNNNTTGNPATASNATHVRNTASNAVTKANTAKANKNNKAEQKAAEAAYVSRPVAKSIAEQQRVIEEIKPKPAGNPSNSMNISAMDKENIAVAKNDTKQTQPDNHQYNSGNNIKPLATTLGNKKIVQAADGGLYKEERDTFKRIDVVSKTFASKNENGRKINKTTFDTVAITRVERISYVPLNTLEMVALHKLEVASTARKTIPVANLKEKIVSSEMVSLVPLANYKVASRKVDPGKFNQLIQNTSQGISNYFDGSHNFYAAFLFGGNTSFGNPGAFGLQLGIAGLYQLNERLTLAAELKYVNHFFSNYSLEDQSVTFENVNSQQISGVQWMFSGTQKTSTSAYKINSFSALEMPITLNYNLGRVSVFGGLNVAYAFSTKWNKENTINTVDVQQTKSENRNPFLNSPFTIDEQKDFSSRFGLGYVWGLNYDISRKVSLDARLTQILWDSNNGNTDAIKRLFHVPSLQFSIGYYFGRKDKVVYIMDKR
jgi:hypothetical protein